MGFWKKLFKQASGREIPALKLAYWRKVGPNLKSESIEFVDDFKRVKFLCPSCKTANYCIDDDTNGVMVICSYCRNISYVPANYKALLHLNLFEIHACVYVPMKEFNDWLMAHPLFLESAKNINQYGLWAYCASCNYQFESSVLHSLPGNTIYERRIFLANSHKSAEDMQALTDGSCPKCAGSNLLALLVKLR